MKISKLVIITPLGLILLLGLVTAWWFLGDDEWVKENIADMSSFKKQLEEIG